MAFISRERVFSCCFKVLVDDLEAEVHFARVNMKPGKPTTFATLTYNGKKKLVLGLPGWYQIKSIYCNKSLELTWSCEMDS